MSRAPNRENIAAFCNENLSHLADNLTTLTIADPSRLKIPFGSKGKLSGRQQVAWPVISPLISPEDCQPPLKCAAPLQPKSAKQSPAPEIVLEISTPKEPSSLCMLGWLIPAGYALFGMALALCNLLTLSSSRMVCSALCPLPMACLALQALSFDSWCSLLAILCASLIPLECAAWNQYAVIPYCIVLAITVTFAAQRRGVVVWVSFTGLFLTLGLALPIPALGLDPRWGVTLSLFFMCLLFTVTSFSVTKVTYKLKYA
jgi:hypothetical protein